MMESPHHDGVPLAKLSIQVHNDIDIDALQRGPRLNGEDQMRLYSKCQAVLGMISDRT